MLFVYSEKGSYFQPYSKIPKKIAKRYSELEVLLSILNGMASSNNSQYHFSSWEDALKAAWKKGKQSGLIDYMSMHYHYHYSRRFDDYTEKRDQVLSEFLHSRIGRHLWASNPRTYQSLNVSRSNVLNHRFFKKAKEAEVAQHFDITGKLGENKNELQTVYSPFMTYLSPKTSLNDQFKALMKLHSENAVMNCEQFVAFALCSIGLIKEQQLATLFSACALKDDLDTFHVALGFDNRQSLNSIEDFENLEESQILFEANLGKSISNDNREVSHMLIYNKADKHIYDLSFGNTKEEWRVKKQSIKEYLEDLTKRKKIVAGTPLSKIELDKGIELSEQKIREHQDREVDLTIKSHLF